MNTVNGVTFFSAGVLEQLAVLFEAALHVISLSKEQTSWPCPIYYCRGCVRIRQLCLQQTCKAVSKLVSGTIVHRQNKPMLGNN